MLYDYDSLLNYPSCDEMREHEKMTEKELMEEFFVRILIVLATIGIIVGASILVYALR